MAKEHIASARAGLAPEPRGVGVENEDWREGGTRVACRGWRGGAGAVQGPAGVSWEGLRERRVKQPPQGVWTFPCWRPDAGAGSGASVVSVSCAQITLALQRKGSSGVCGAGSWGCVPGLRRGGQRE